MMHRWLTILAFLVFAPPASAIVRRHDLPDSNYISAGSSQHQVVWLVGTDGRYGTGTLIAPDWILTAGHFGADPDNLEWIDVTSGPNSGGPSLGTVINVASPYLGNLAAGNDIKLLQLSSPVSYRPGTSTPLPPLNRHSGTVGSLVGQQVQIVGYGDAGNGIDGPTGSPGTKRSATNVVDGTGALLNPPNSPIYTGGPFSTNFVVADFDGVGSTNRWGSANPLALEGGPAPGDSGGPWLLNGTVSAVTSFGGSNSFKYRDAMVATAVSPWNDWINSAMGGVNWNTRNQAFFNNATAWGDGRVPNAGTAVQFSLPNMLNSKPVVVFESNTVVGDVQVEFGPHEFDMRGKEFRANGPITVDHGGTMIPSGGTLTATAADGIRVGHFAFGTLHHESGVVQVDGNLFLGSNLGASGDYKLFTGSTLKVDGNLNVGHRGGGEFFHNGGTVNAIDVAIGNISGSNGFYYLDGGILNSEEVRVGLNNGANGELVINQATLRATERFTIGVSGDGTVRQVGGTVVADAIEIGANNTSQGEYDLSGGILNVYDGEISFGSGIQKQFNFTGGTLQVGTFNGDLDNGNLISGGTLAPGNSAGLTIINGNYTQASTGALEIEIGGTTAGISFDQIKVEGPTNTATLAGLLDVSLIGGFVPNVGDLFTVLTASSITNNGLVLGGAAASMFDLIVGSSSVVLQAVNPGPSGDFNHDGTVNAADYVAWRKNPGPYMPESYTDWRTNFGVSPGSGTPPDFSPPAVPEPSGLLLAVLGACFGVCMKRRRRAIVLPLSLILGSAMLSDAVLAAPAVCLADYNEDGSCVDAADFVTWRKFEGTFIPLSNDGGLGTPIRLEHNVLWRGHFAETGGGAAPPPGAISAPEPCSALLALIGGLVVAYAASSRRRR